MTLFEVDGAANRIRQEVDEDANIIFGSSIDETMNGRLRVSVVATGIDAAEAREAERPRLVAVGGGGAVHAVSNQFVAAQPAGRSPGGFVPRQAAQSVPARAGTFVAPAQTAQAQPQQPPMQPAQMMPGQVQPVHMAPVQPAGAPTAEAPAMSSQPHGEHGLRAPVATRPAMQPASATPPLRSLFQRATGGLMRRTVTEVQPVAEPPAQPARTEPASQRPAQRAPQPDEMGLDIPTFLRRQGN
jgi:cell division protein FtsZ